MLSVAISSRVRVEADDLSVERLELREHGLVGEQHARLRVREHERDPVLRQLGIDGHIRAARLQCCELGDDEVERALERDRDERVRLHAGALQASSELVRARVQLRVGELLVLEDDGNGVRRAQRAGLDQGMERELRVVLLLAVRSDEQFLSLVLRDHRQVVDRGVGRVHRGSKQVNEVIVDPLDRLRVEKVGAVLPHRVEPTEPLLHEEEEIDSRRGDLRLDLLGLDARELQLRLGRVDGEEHLKERVAAEVALGLELPDEELEGKIRVRPGAGDTLLHPLQQLAERRRIGEVAAQDDGVEEDADRVVELRPRAVVDRHAHDEVRFAGVPPQQHFEDCEERVEERCSLGVRQLLERGCRLLRQRKPAPRAAEARNLRPLPIRGELEDGGHPVELARPVGEVRVQGVAREPRALPVGELDVLPPRFRERRRKPRGERVVEGAELAVEQDLRPLVEDDVVDDDLQDVVGRGEPDQLRAEEPRCAEIERPPALLVDQVLRRRFGAGLSGDVDDVECERSGIADELYRLAVLHREARSQRFVPAHDLGKRTIQRCDVESSPKPDRPREVVRDVPRR